MNEEDEISEKGRRKSEECKQRDEREECKEQEEEKKKKIRRGGTRGEGEKRRKWKRRSGNK